jgi:hypothetical protein
MADIKGYVNPRSLGNDEPQQFLHMDIFFEQELWDEYIVNKNTKRRDLYTWDATIAAAMTIRGAALAVVRQSSFDEGFYFTCKIGHHKPCELRVYQHHQFMALCVGLAKKERYQS